VIVVPRVLSLSNTAVLAVLCILYDVQIMWNHLMMPFSELIPIIMWHLTIIIFTLSKYNIHRVFTKGCLLKNKMLILTYQCLIKCIFCPVCWLTSLSKHCIKYVLSTHQIIWFFFFSAGDWTQGLTHAKQLFYLWATPPAPKFYFYFYFLFTYLFF
jgi:hypothetical protein